MLLDIADDKGISHEATQAGFARRLWNDMEKEKCFWHRGDMVKLGRFMSTCHRARQELPLWSTRLLSLLYFAMETGQINRGMIDDLIQKKAALQVQSVRQGDDEIAPPLAKETKESEQKFRNVCKSTLKLAILMLSDPENKVRQRIKVTVAESLEKWQTFASSSSRSSEGNKKFMVDMCGLSFHDLLQRFLLPLTSSR